MWLSTCRQDSTIDTLFAITQTSVIFLSLFLRILTTWSLRKKRQREKLTKERNSIFNLNILYFNCTVYTYGINSVQGIEKFSKRYDRSIVQRNLTQLQISFPVDVSSHGEKARNFAGQKERRTRRRGWNGLSELFRPVIGTYAAYGIIAALAGRACSPPFYTRSAIKPGYKPAFLACRETSQLFRDLFV